MRRFLLALFLGIVFLPSQGMTTTVQQLQKPSTTVQPVQAVPATKATTAPAPTTNFSIKPISPHPINTQQLANPARSYPVSSQMLRRANPITCAEVKAYYMQDIQNIERKNEECEKTLNGEDVSRCMEFIHGIELKKATTCRGLSEENKKVCLGLDSPEAQQQQSDCQGLLAIIPECCWNKTADHCVVGGISFPQDEIFFIPFIPSNSLSALKGAPTSLQDKICELCGDWPSDLPSPQPPAQDSVYDPTNSCLKRPLPNH